MQRGSGSVRCHPYPRNMVDWKVGKVANGESGSHCGVPHKRLGRVGSGRYRFVRSCWVEDRCIANGLVIYMFLGFRKVEEEVDILWKEGKVKHYGLWFRSFPFI